MPSVKVAASTFICDGLRIHMQLQLVHSSGAIFLEVLVTEPQGDVAAEVGDFIAL